MKHQLPGALVIAILCITSISHAASDDDELPLSRDALFALEPQEADGAELRGGEKTSLPDSKEDLFAIESAVETSVAIDAPALPSTRDALFGAEPGEAPLTESASIIAASGSSGGLDRISGFFQAELAYTYANPEHWSKALGRLEMGSQGRLSTGMRWKLGGRVYYNAIYDLTDDYQRQVRNDLRAEFQLGDAYLDFSTGVWDWRVGRQHVVWGEMVGLFFADVVSAKDLREFILPDFQVLRIPQWAARAEFFKDDFHAELVWIPFPSYDEIGKPQHFTGSGLGADFYPYPPATRPFTIRREEKPSTSLAHTNFGVRVNQLNNGWDLAGFIYTSMNSAPTLYQFTPSVFTPRHDRIWQLGGTLAKDMRDFVLKAEAVYTDGRCFNLVVPGADTDGVVKQDTLDWVIGAEFNTTSDTRVNVQFYERYFFDHNPGIIPDRMENGATLLVSHKLSGNWNIEALLVHSLNRRDWMLRPKASWGFQPNWKLTMGLDIFGGPAMGLFGQYERLDRAYAELRYDF